MTFIVFLLMYILSYKHIQHHLPDSLAPLKPYLPSTVDYFTQNNQIRILYALFIHYRRKWKKIQADIVQYKTIFHQHQKIQADIVQHEIILNRQEAILNNIEHLVQDAIKDINYLEWSLLIPIRKVSSSLRKSLWNYYQISSCPINKKTWPTEVSNTCSILHRQSTIKMFSIRLTSRLNQEVRAQSLAWQVPPSFIYLLGYGAYIDLLACPSPRVLPRWLFLHKRMWLNAGVWPVILVHLVSHLAWHRSFARLYGVFLSGTTFLFYFIFYAWKRLSFFSIIYYVEGGAEIYFIIWEEFKWVPSILPYPEKFDPIRLVATWRWCW